MNYFPSWIESVIGTKEVEYYELNDRFTLALVQGVDAFLFDKNDFYKSTRDNSRIGVMGKEVYRVFFYSDTRFALVYGNSLGSTAELYDVIVNKDSPRTPMESVSFDNIHPHLVTGGYYRDEKVAIGHIDTHIAYTWEGTGYDSDFTVNWLGSRSVGPNIYFDKDDIEADVKQLFTNLPTNAPIRDEPAPALSDGDPEKIRAWSKNTFTVDGTTFTTSGTNPPMYHYRFDVTYNISSGEPKEAIYYKSDGIIMART